MNDDRPGTPRPIGASLEQLLGYIESPSIDALSVIFGEWETVVGPDVAQHTKPAAIDGENLVVTATDPVWARELQWLETEVINRIRRLTESEQITRIRVRVQPR